MTGSSYGPSELSASAQDTSADSNVFNTQGPSANHGSISFNFHVNHENFSNPLGKSAKGQAPHQFDELKKQNDLLKKIISQIAPSIIPTGAKKEKEICQTHQKNKAREALGQDVSFLRCVAHQDPLGCPTSLPRRWITGFPWTDHRFQFFERSKDTLRRLLGFLRRDR